MLLYINTTDNDVAEVVLVSPKKQIAKRFESLPHAEDFTSSIKRFLQTHKFRLSDISKVAVKVGPGFFSRVRTGVVAANALAFALNIPIVPIRGAVNYAKIQNAKGQGMVEPFYGAKPNITKPKKR